MQNKDVYIVIPSYNEGEALRRTVESLLPCGYEIIVVDDGSREDPRMMLEDLPIHYLRHPINLGQGAALQTGMDYAKAQGAEVVIHFDADGQHDKNDIPQFLSALEAGAEVVIGSRFLRDSDLALVPKGKRILLRCARLVNGFFTGMWLTDAHNGFRALNRKALESIDLMENRMAHASEIMSQIRAAKLKVAEVPVTIRYTEYSKAKGQKWTNSLNILIDLILNKIM
ncbi:MAG: glycosyltransferase family 2 protein [Lentisphaeria bacterium]|nr:glycosyltransferase family 2 protein [Lentisphaeria bacterium]